MVTVQEHGTRCCGAYSMSGMRLGVGDTASIEIALQRTHYQSLVDVTMNSMQINSKPHVMAELKRLGFVLDAHWTNGLHHSNVYRFTRCPSRKPLLSGLNEGAWTGMTAAMGDLHGPLPDIDRNRQAPRNTYFNGIEVGMLVRVNGTSRRAGREFEVTRVGMEYRPGNGWRAGRDAPRIFMRDDAGEFSIVRRNCTIVRRNEDIVVPVAPAADMIHVGIVAAGGEATVVFSTFHNVYRGGHRGAGYDTLAEAREARRGAGRVDRRDIMSNGEIAWETLP